MTNIRNGVFETNSSSMHSIAVRKNHHTLTKKEFEKEKDFLFGLDKENNYHVSVDEFGRDFEILYSMYDKARYIIAAKAMCDFDDVERFVKEEIVPVFKEYCPELNDFIFPLDIYVDEDGNDIFDYGCIDHQSQNLVSEFLQNNNVTIKEFLTDTAYIIVIDSDEILVLKDMIENRVVHKEDFEKIVYA